MYPPLKRIHQFDDLRGAGDNGQTPIPERPVEVGPPILARQALGLGRDAGARRDGAEAPYVERRRAGGGGRRRGRCQGSKKPINFFII